MSSAGWAPYLDPGEVVLWQGRPDGAVTFAASHILTIAFGLAFAGFALFWMVMAAQAPGPFWMFGLIHFSAGLAIIAGPILWPAYRRRHSWYTLTDRRAMIATDLPLRGRKLETYPISPDTPLTYLPGPPATLHFAQRERRGSKGRRQTVDIGFERIADGDSVFGLMRQIQRGADVHTL